MKSFNLLTTLAVGMALTLSISINGQDASPRGIKIEPVSAAPKGGSAGLFVGVNEFDEPTVAPLRFAVNDAIAQADLFVNELKLIQANNCWLALSGSPEIGSPWEDKLNSLKAGGIQVISATKISVLRQLRLISRIADRPEELLIVSISAHGFEESGDPYALGRDGLLGPVLLPETGISLRAVEGLMDQSLAQKRLLILDACRERPTRGSRSIGSGAASAAFREAFAEATGRAVLASCDAGQSSFEDPRLGHGVFTYHLIAGLRGEANPDGSFLTLGGVSDYVSQSVESWVRKNRPELPRPQWQRPWFKGPNDARSIPLALATPTAVAVVEPKVQIAIETPASQLTEEEILDIRKRLAMSYLQDAIGFGLENRVPSEVYDRVGVLMSILEGSLAEVLIEKLEVLKDNTPENRKAFMDAWNRNSETPTKSLNLEIASEAGSESSSLPAKSVPDFNSEVLLANTQPETTETSPIRRDETWISIDESSVPALGEDFEIPELGLKMIWVPSGEFTMGTKVSAMVRRDEYPHKVNISQGFWLSATEVTAGQWERILNDQILNGPEAELAKSGISWEQAMNFCNKLFGREMVEGRIPGNYFYTLPTEAEWEYACRAGTTTLWPIGGTAGISGATLNQYAWYQYSSGKKVNPVGLKLPNDWGFYDMLGNVREYCWDDYGTYPSKATDQLYVSKKSRSEKVARGGSYEDPPSTCRSAARTRIKRNEIKGDFYGFRVALSAIPRPSQ